MPLTFFAHQAAVLPLKIKWPHLFCGQALVLGSMSPHFEFFLTGRTQWAMGHTLLGQFTFCLPLTLLMLYGIGRRRSLLRWAGKELSPSETVPDLKSQLILWLPFLLFSLVGFAVLWCLAAGSHRTHMLAFWSAILLRTVSLAFIGLCIGCALCAWQLRVRSQKTDDAKKHMIQ